MEPPDLRGTGCKHCCVYQALEPGDWRWREMQIYFMVKMTYPINKVYSSAHRVGVECLHMPSISLVLPTLSPALFCPFPHCVSLSLYLSRLLPSLCPPLFLSLPHLLPSLCLSLSISFPLLPSLVLLCDLFAAGTQLVTVTAQAHAPLAFTPTTGPGDTRVRQRSCHCPGY